MAVNENQTKVSQVPDTKRGGVVPSASADSIVDAILRDHGPIKAKLETLKDTQMDRAAKEPIYQEWLPALMSHSRAEELTLYVMMKHSPPTRIEGFEGDTEHAVADQLVQEIHSCADDGEWTAKVKVLAEMLEHHIEEEETEMLKDVSKQFGEDQLRALGAEYNRLKEEVEVLLKKSSTALASH